MAVVQVPNVCPKCGAKAGQDGWKLYDKTKRGDNLLGKGLNVVLRPSKPRKVDETWICNNCRFEGEYRVK